MTCVALLKHNKKIWMGADRRVSWGWHQSQRMPNPKITKNKWTLIGGCGASHILNLAIRFLEIPNDSDSVLDVDTFIFYDIVPQLNRLLLDHGFTDQNKQLMIPSDMDTEIVIGVKGRAYSLDIQNPDSNSNVDTHVKGLICVDEVSFPYATGCGGQIAWGHLLATEGLDISPKHRLEQALSCAALVSPGCDNNIDIIKE